jgi:hypothetical protein
MPKSPTIETVVTIVIKGKRSLSKIELDMLKDDIAESLITIEEFADLDKPSPCTSHKVSVK